MTSSVQENKLRKLFLFLLFSFLFINLVSAVESLPGAKTQNQKIELIQVCDNCTYVNLTTVQLPNSTILTVQTNMTLSGNTYNYSFTGADRLGFYIYTTCGDPDGVYTCKSVDFEVTTTGEKVSLSNAVMVIAFLVLAIICLVLGYSFVMEYWLMKTFFFFCSVLSGILAINTARIIASESSALSKMGTSGLLIGIVLFGIFFIVMFVFAFIEIIKAFRYKEELRWNYDM